MIDIVPQIACKIKIFFNINLDLIPKCYYFK